MVFQHFYSRSRCNSRIWLRVWHRNLSYHHSPPPGSEMKFSGLSEPIFDLSSMWELLDSNSQKSRYKPSMKNSRLNLKYDDYVLVCIRFVPIDRFIHRPGPKSWWLLANLVQRWNSNSLAEFSLGLPLETQVVERPWCLSRKELLTLLEKPYF